MISCKRATELISNSMEEPLTLKEELELRLHLFICEFCKRFQNQVELVREALGRSKDCSEPASDNPELTSCASAKKRLREKLRQSSER